jgi:hypothetical protein
MNNYPAGFSEENKKDFDILKGIAQTIPEYVALVYDGTSYVTIEVAAEKISGEMWLAIDQFNAQARSLSTGFALVSEDIQGERYV